MRLLQVFFFCLIAFNLKADKINFSGSITDIPKGPKSHLYLFAHVSGNTVFVDSLKIDTKGKFEYESSIDLEAGVFYLSLDKVNLKPLVLSPSEKETQINASYDDWNKGDVKISSSKENELYSVLMQLVAGHEKLIKEYREKLNISRVDSFYERELEAVEDYLSYRYTQLNQSMLNIQRTHTGTYVADILSLMYVVPQMSEYPEVSQNYDNTIAFLHDHYWDFTDFKDPRILNTPEFTSKLGEYVVNYADFSALKAQSSIDKLMSRASQNPMVYDYCLRYLLSVFTERNMDAQAVYLIQSYVDKEGVSLLESTATYVNSFRQYLRGMRVNDFASKTATGEEVRLSEVLAKNKATILYFWSSTDKASTAMNNDLLQIKKAIATEGLGIIGVAFENDGIQWKNTVDALKLDWVNVSDIKGGASPLISQYNIKQLPHLLLLSANGTIVLRNPDLKQLMAVLLEAFQNPQ